MSGMKKAQLKMLPIASLVWNSKVHWPYFCLKYMNVYPVEDGCPALHSDALEHSQHGEDDVVKGGDPVVGPLPLLQADRLVGPK